MPAPRAVLDTNVLVASLLGKGSPSRLYRAFKEGRFLLVSSNVLIAELAEVLLRPKLAIPSQEIKAAFRLIRRRSAIIRPKLRLNVCRDPKDDIVLECAMTGDVDWIVTGDKDLLSLHSFRGITIASPTAFLKHLSALR